MPSFLRRVFSGLKATGAAVTLLASLQAFKTRSGYFGTSTSSIPPSLNNSFLSTLIQVFISSLHVYLILEVALGELTFSVAQCRRHLPAFVSKQRRRAPFIKFLCGAEPLPLGAGKWKTFNMMPKDPEWILINLSAYESVRENSLSCNPSGRILAPINDTFAVSEMECRNSCWQIRFFVCQLSSSCFHLAFF